MRLRIPLTLVVLAVLVCSVALAQEGQKKDEQVVDDFVTTRGVSFEEPAGKKPGRKPTTPSTRRNRPSSGKGSASGDMASGKTPKKGLPNIKSGQGGGSEIAAQSAGTQTADDAGVQILKAGGVLRPLALGYTFLMKDEAGRLFVADASREFKTGERFAVALETNADGYLYMFSAENGRNPELLFPNAQIDGGSNSVAAHARATFPTGAAAEEEHFIEFTAPAATEHLFIIFSRRPLGDVPAGEALVKFCAKNLEDCAWRPTAAQWADILQGTKGRRVTEVKSLQLAQAGPPPAMPVMLHRGLKVKKDDPKPAIVRVNDSPDADILVTEIVLTHK